MAGKVVKVYSDGDMRVSINDQTWTFNPLCCYPRHVEQWQIDNTTITEENPGFTKNPGSLTTTTAGMLSRYFEFYTQLSTCVKSSLVSLCSCCCF